MKAADLARESKSGEVIFIGQIDKFYTVNKKRVDDLIALPMDVFGTLDEALQFAKDYLDQNQGAGFDVTACAE